MTKHVGADHSPGAWTFYSTTQHLRGDLEFRVGTSEVLHPVRNDLCHFILRLLHQPMASPFDGNFLEFGDELLSLREDRGDCRRVRSSPYEEVWKVRTEVG